MDLTPGQQEKMKEVYSTAGRGRANLYVECDNGQRTTVHTLKQARLFAEIVGAKAFSTSRYRKGKGYTDRKSYTTEV